MRQRQLRLPVSVLVLQDHWAAISQSLHLLVSILIDPSLGHGNVCLAQDRRDMMFEEMVSHGAPDKPICLRVNLKFQMICAVQEQPESKPGCRITY